MKNDMDWESWKMKTQNLSSLRGHTMAVLHRMQLGIVFLGLFIAGSFPVYAQEDVGATGQALEDVEFVSLPGDRVQVKLSLSGTQEVEEPLSFTIDNPARIALDFTATTSNIARKIPIGMGIARSINAVEAKGRTRVVLNLVRMVQYETRVDGPDFYIILGSDVVMGTSPAVADGESGEEGEIVHQVIEAQHEIKNIDFRRGKKGEAHIVVTLSNPATPVNITEEGGNVVLDFLGAALPDEFIRRLDVIILQRLLPPSIVLWRKVMLDWL